MRKLCYVPFLLMLMLALVGCNTDSDNASETSDNVNETTEVIEEDLEEVQEKSLRQNDDTNNNTSTDSQLENEPQGNTGPNSEQQPPVTNDVGGQGITDEGQNNDANNEAD
ncbi:hypothetical protein [Ureibacillus aquaedulcis]|uniref:Secreted protein n=1 Tax=Ureibacillus aquaedulcis TaxID=3058421 RepID=A0ABT8GQ30_9BACL|nr:hypothetical protein [Ureibacillus sp. BA0131]MDN4493522.1 hypothetical protein [Ureibacillus sp. BA0131]